MSNLLNLTTEDITVSFPADYSKKSAKAAADNLVKQVFEDGGSREALKFMSAVVRYKEFFDALDKGVREKLDLSTKDSWNGVTFTPKNGAEKLNYSEDLEVADLEERLKARKELVKLATKSKDLIFDSEGCEVTRVSSTFNKSSITVEF